MLVTRALDEGSDFVKLLEEHGAQVTSLPLIRIAPPTDERALQTAVDEADTYSWIVFTSAAGVDSFARRRRGPLNDVVRIAAVGPATQRAVAERLGRSSDVVPAEFSASSLADAIKHNAEPGDSMLIVAAHDASPVLARKLSNAGHRVHKVDAYTTVEVPPPDIGRYIAVSDVITLASASAVRALVRGLGDDAPAQLRGKVIACIGPVSTLEARERGLHVEIVPDSATFPALVESLCRYYTTQRS